MTLTANLPWHEDRTVLAFFARALADAGMLTTRDETLYLLGAPGRWDREFDAWDSAGRPQRVTVGRHAEDWHRFLDALDELGADRGHDAYMRDRHPAYWYGDDR